MKSLFILLFLTPWAQAQTQNLSPAEQELAENYLHSGLANRTYVEECEKNQEACTGKEAYVFGPTGDTVVRAVSKIYSLFGLFGGIGGSDTLPAETASAEEGSAVAESSVEGGGESKELQDWCRYIPPGFEAVALISQQNEQNQISTSTNSTMPQRDALLKAARNHKSRARTAKVQTAGWGATSACYVAFTIYRMNQGATIAKTTWAKMAGASFLTGFFIAKAKKSHDYQEQVENIAKKLPGAGDCNPVTENSCYCSQPETKYDTLYCVPQDQAQSLNCLNQAREVDPECQCLNSGDCFDVNYAQLGSQFSLGNVFTNGTLVPLQQASQGQISAGTSLSAQSQQSAALANRLFNEQASQSLDESFTAAGLTPEQKEESLALQQLGLNPAVANFAVRQKSDPQIPARLTSLGVGVSRYQAPKKAAVSKALKSQRSIPRFPAPKARKQNLFSFNKNKKSTRKPSSNILHFSQKAQARAQVNRNKESSLWDIISRRYQVKTWRKSEN